MTLITDTQWQEYEDAINQFHSDAFQENILWISIINKIDKFGEDGNEKKKEINLKGLITYNYFRSWPMNKDTQTGEIDKESILVFFNNKYLSDLGYINVNGQFKFDPSKDRFKVRGVQYKASGDSQVSQTKDKPLLHFIILKREEIDTGNPVY